MSCFAPGGWMRDDEVADRDDRAHGAGEDAGQQLGSAEGRRAGGEAGNGSGSAEGGRWIGVSNVISIRDTNLVAVCIVRPGPIIDR